MISTKGNFLKMILILGVLAFSAIFPFFAPSYLMELFLSIITYVILVAAWNILSGYTGYLFLGTSAFYGLGAYILAYIQGIGVLFAIPIVAIICFIIAFFIGFPFFRIRGVYFTIASYALSLLFGNLFLYYEQVFKSTTGRTVPIQSSTTIYTMFVFFAITTLMVAYLIKRYRLGFGFLIIKGNEEVAEVIGVNTVIYKCIAFGISAAIMGTVGATSILRGGYVDTTIAFGNVISFNTLIMGVLGGLGNITGGLISSILLSSLYSLFGTSGDPFTYLIIMGLLTYIIMLVSPKGIGGAIDKIRLKRKGG